MICSRSLAATALALACSVSLSFGCDKEEKKKSDSNEAKPGEAPCEGGTDAAGLACDPANPPVARAGPGESALGLAQGCETSEGAKGTCIVCRLDHDIPFDACAEGKISKPAEQCKTTMDDEGSPGSLSCTADGGKVVTLDFKKYTGLQKLYNNFGTIVGVARLALSAKLEKDPEKRDLIVGMLDVLDKYKKELFTIGEIAPAIDEVGDVVKRVLGDKIPDDKLAVMKEQIKKTVSNLQQRRKAGTMTNGDLIGLASGWIGAVPKEALGGGDIGSLLEMLNGAAGDNEALAKILDQSADGATLTDDE